MQEIQKKIKNKTLQNKVKEEYNIIMLFITCNPYFSEINDIPVEINQECFVCFESENGIESMVRLSEISLFGYEKNCDCNGSIHNKCLAKWYALQQKCPICRQRMDKNIMIDDLRMHSSELRLTIILVIFQRILFFNKMIWFFFVLYFLYDSLVVSNKIIMDYEYYTFY